MVNVPLSGFPPEFDARCSKCRSPNLHFTNERHPFVWGQQELHLRCFLCGTVKYGEAAIRAVLDPQLKVWEEEQVAARERAREEAERQAREAERQAREAERQAREAAQAQEEAERQAAQEKATLAPVCAWEGCTMPALGRSKYCSRTCSNNNAHARAKARRAAEALEAALAETPVQEPSRGVVLAELVPGARRTVLYRRAHFLPHLPSHHAGTVTG
jgi:multidrug efflux pump subunit AcrA (membrane-fusion protein)